MTRRPQRTVGAAALLRRHLRAGRGPGILLAVLLFFSTSLLAALPGVTESRGAAELRYQVGHLGPTQRFLTSRVFDPVPEVSAPVDGFSPEVAAVWGGWDTALATVRADAPEPLRAALGRPVYTSVTDPVPLPRSTVVNAELHLSLAADPRLADAARLVQGSWPAADGNEPDSTVPLQVALSVQTAQALGWRIGTVQRTTMGTRRVHPLLLTGLFEAAAGSADHWLLNGNILRADIIEFPNHQERTGIAYVHPASWPLAEALVPREQTQVYFPLDVGAVRSSDVSALRAQIDVFTAAAHPLTGLPGAVPLRLSSRSGMTLRAVEASLAVARILLLVLAIGPAGAALAVLLLACRLLLDRRSRALGLLANRGWTRGRLRLLLAAEGTALAVPAVGLAIVPAALFAPPDRPAELLLPLTFAVLLVPLLLAFAATPTGRPGRGEHPPRRARRRRWVLEVLLLGVAAASVTLLSTGDGPASGGGVDPLVVAAPLLLCLASAVLVTRLYPLPLRALLRRFRQRSGLVGFLGSARVVREPGSGVVPVFALVVGVGTAVLSAILLTTLDSGVLAAARSQVGADLRVAAAHLSPAAVARVRAVPGVASVATSMTLDPVQVQVSGIEQAMAVHLVDAGQLRTVQAGVQGAVTVPASVAGPGPAGQVVVSTDLAARLREARTSSLVVDRHRLTVAGASASAAGLGPGMTWILADRSLARYFTDAAYQPDNLLIRLLPDTDSASAATAVGAAVAGEGAVITPAQVSAGLLASPAVGGVRLIVLTAMIGMAVLSALAVTLLSVGTASTRRRLLAVLGILGLPPGVGRRLVGWELLPPSLAAFVGGGAVGVGLSRIVVSTIDLRPFTGGTAPPAVVAGGWVLTVLVGGFGAVVAAATLVGAAVAGRASAAVVMRFGDT